jgi:hypothetical protein
MLCCRSDALLTREDAASVVFFYSYPNSCVAYRITTPDASFIDDFKVPTFQTSWRSSSSVLSAAKLYTNKHKPLYFWGPKPEVGRREKKELKS